MRHLLPLLALSLLAAPVHAADQTEALHLTNISAGEAEHILLTAPTNLEALIPAGIHAWSVDSRANNLVLVGDPAAIDQLRKIIRLVDVPPRKIRLHVKVLQPDVALDPLKERGAKKEDWDLIVLGISEDADRAIIRNRAVLSEFHVEVSNDRTFHLRPTGFGKPLPFVARLNGDNSVTFVLPEDADHPKVSPLVRIEQGAGLLVFATKLGQTLFVEVEGLGP